MAAVQRVLTHPRLDLIIAITWALLAVAEIAALAANRSALLAATVAWMGGYLSPYVLAQATDAYRRSRR